MIKIKLLNEDSQVPTRSTSGAGAFDLYSSEDVLIIPGHSEVVGTGVAVEIPLGWMGLLSHRSSMAFKGNTIASLGYIDSDYRAEIKIKLFNLGSDGIRICKGDRIAQIAFIETYQGNQIEIVADLSETHRGAGGFGSTGV